MKKLMITLLLSWPGSALASPDAGIGASHRCTVYRVVEKQEDSDVTMLKQGAARRTRTEYEVEVRGWNLAPAPDAEARATACEAKAKEICDAAQRARGCRYEVHADSPAGWDEATALAPEAKKRKVRRKRKARKRKRRRAKKKVSPRR